MANPVGGRRRSILGGLLALPVLLVAGCGQAPAIKPAAVDAEPAPRLSLRIAAGPDANRGPGGKALPVVVRVYALKGVGGFSGADFFSLYDRDAAVLGADLLARDEVTLAPGQFVPIDRPLQPEAGYLGVLVAFRDIDHSHWRESLRLHPGVDNRVEIEVGPASLTIRQR